MEVRKVCPRQAVVRLERAMHLALVSPNYLGATQDLLNLSVTALLFAISQLAKFYVY